MSKRDQAEALEAIIAKRLSHQQLKLDLAKHSFPEQAAFIRDPAQMKAALCTRRAGKSWACAFMLVQTALKHPKTTSIFLSYTRATAKNTLWQPLQDLCRDAKIKCTPNHSSLSLRLDNGSFIQLQGAEKKDQIEKLRGNAYPLIVIDECGHGAYRTSLDYLVNEVAMLNISDFNGSIVLIGTPSPFTDSLFYRITGPETPDSVQGWSVHRWSWENNVSTKLGHRICDNARKLLSSKIKSNPTYPTTDGYKREWQGQWAIDSSELVYRFDPTKNLIPALPNNNYHYIISVDPAWGDGTAFLVAAYAQNDPTLYIVEAFKHKKLDLFDVDNYVSSLALKYPTNHFVIDAGGGAKQAVETFKRRTSRPWKAITKTPNYKFVSIEQLNGDLRNSKIKLIAGKTGALVSEMSKLVKDPKNPSLENQSQPNDLCDTLLYAWIESRHYNSKAPLPNTPLDPNSFEYAQTAPQQEYYPIKESDHDDNPFDNFDLSDFINSRR